MKLPCSACNRTGKLGGADCCICGGKGWRWVYKAVMLSWEIAESLKYYPRKAKRCRR